MIHFLIAQQDINQFYEWHWPQSPIGWIALLLVSLVMIVSLISIYRRDTQELPVPIRILLPILRMGALVGLFIVFLNPTHRIQTNSIRPSRVALLVDVSSSMQNPSEDISESLDETTTRTDAISQILADSDLLPKLRETHDVLVYTFDRDISSPIATLSKWQPTEEEGTENEPLPDLAFWKEQLQPRGIETRLGESTLSMIRELNQKTLSGIVIISDGASNAGIDVQTANELARIEQKRLLTVGVGGTKPAVNLQVTKLIAPSEIQLGDGFDISVYIQGEGLAGEQVDLQLFAQERGTDAPSVKIDDASVTLLEDSVPVQFDFPRFPVSEGELIYRVEATPQRDLREIKLTDNSREVAVKAYDRPTRVLLSSGGPSWDYRFLSSFLHRHPGFEVDVLLQTGRVGISQDANDVLFEFPEEKADLFQYDAIILFDVQWDLISEDSLRLVEEWVGREGGGFVYIAGDIHTPILATSQERYPDIWNLLPVYLEPFSLIAGYENDHDRLHRVMLTPEGEAAPVMQVTDDLETSKEFWESFPGFFHCYSTNGAKPSALVYAHLDEGSGLTADTRPILLASQFYGQGRSFYLGCPELYRLRSVSPEFYERFWIKLLRDASQARRRSGNTQATLLVDQGTLTLGETTKIRARILDAEFQPLSLPEVPLEIKNPEGELITDLTRLTREADQNGYYGGSLRGQIPGRYEIRLAVPNSSSDVNESILFEIPNLENRNLRQDVKQLRLLAEGTGGNYLPLGDIQQLPNLLPDASEQFLLGETIRALWDRSWFLIVVISLLGVEWLLRKIYRLA